jgi:hypothetical protein
VDERRTLEGGLSPASHLGGPVSTAVLSTRVLWWTKWHGDRLVLCVLELGKAWETSDRCEYCVGQKSALTFRTQWIPFIIVLSA